MNEAERILLMTVARVVLDGVGGFAGTSVIPAGCGSRPAAALCADRAARSTYECPTRIQSAAPICSSTMDSAASPPMDANM